MRKSIVQKGIIGACLLVLPLVGLSSFTSAPRLATQQEVKRGVEIEVTIDKDTKDSEFKEITKRLKKHDIQAKFRGVKRNKQGEITSIKIDLKDNNGNESSTALSSSSPIEPLTIGAKDGSLYITSANSKHFSVNGKHSVTKHFDFEIDDEDHVIVLNGKKYDLDKMKKEMKEKIKKSFIIEEDGDGKKIILKLNGSDYDFDFDFDFDEHAHRWEEHARDMEKHARRLEEKAKHIERRIERRMKEREHEMHNRKMELHRKKFHFVDDPDIEKYIVIDGKPANFKKLDQLAKDDKLDTVDFLKPATAQSVYGKKAKDGAIIATTKK